MKASDAMVEVVRHVDRFRIEMLNDGHFPFGEFVSSDGETITVGLDLISQFEFLFNQLAVYIDSKNLEELVSLTDEVKSTGWTSDESAAVGAVICSIAGTKKLSINKIERGSINVFNNIDEGLHVDISHPPKDLIQANNINLRERMIIKKLVDGIKESEFSNVDVRWQHKIKDGFRPDFSLYKKEIICNS